ncbi:MAG TPA: metallophosphoesterase, partial [Methanomassiliicoccales archaeon]|nr:metallophosphoesterase [Methanomassiliicoccales archaeon]
MRFLVLSDIHMRENVKRWAAELMKDHKADGAIVLGDITHFGPPEWAEGFLTSLKGKVISLPGNCDPELSFKFMERSSVFIHGRAVEIAGRTFVGFGGSNPTIFNTPNEMPEDEIYQRLRQIMAPNAILV